MNYIDRVFQNELVFLDGNTYKGCKFLECHLTFSGTTGVNFDNCLFRRCNWNFEGAAATTLSFLSAIAQGIHGEPDNNLFDTLVETIRQGVPVGDVNGILEAEPIAS